MPMAPSSSMNGVTADRALTAWVSMIWMAVAIGPMPLARSFEPCAKAIAAPVNTISGTNSFSTLAK